jgi:hypothetical protein
MLNADPSYLLSREYSTMGRNNLFEQDVQDTQTTFILKVRNLPLRTLGSQQRFKTRQLFYKTLHIGKKSK